nr:hypothetical protein [Tanacetum cinerariifolium]
MHDTSSSSGNYITHVVDANIRPVNDQVPFAKVQLTAQHNILANEQQHIDQSEPIYDTYLLEKVDSNTSHGSTNMCHKGGEIDQDAKHDQVKCPLLKAEFLKTKDMVEKEVYNELSNRFLQLKKHCFPVEISIQQKKESFQTNKPCKNQDSFEFHEFFEINELKAQLQAKNLTINNLKKQIKHVHVKSNEAKVKHDIDALETINIELESSVAKLLAENEKLNKENEHLKQTYKELFDLQIHTKDHHDSLIAQVNSRAKVQSPKTRNINKPVEPKSHTQNPDSQIAIGQRFSLNKSSAVHEKQNTHRSCLRWILTGRIFETAGFRWIPTRNMFTDSTTKVDSEPPNGSNEDITNPYECKQSLDVSACTLNLSAILAAVASLRVVDPAGSPSSTTIDQDVPSASTSPTTHEIQSQVTHQGAEEQIHGHQNAQFDNVPLLHNLSSELSSKETSLQGFIPLNLHHLNQSFDTLTKLTMNHPLENVICDPSRLILTRSQLQGHAIW